MKNNIVINIVASVFSFFGSILFFFWLPLVFHKKLTDRYIYQAGMKLGSDCKRCFIPGILDHGTSQRRKTIVTNFRED